MDSQLFHSPKASRCKYCGREILWLKSRNGTPYCVQAYWQPKLRWYAGHRTDFHNCRYLAAPPDTLGAGKRDKPRTRHTL